MIELNVPLRDQLLYAIPLFVRVEPLMRPRMNFHSKSVYQPIKNQQELFAELKQHKLKEPINSPIIVDSYVYYEKKGKETYPTQKTYGDEDNLRKAINDAMVRLGIITDDKMVVGGENYKLFADEDCAYVLIWSLSEVFEVKQIG